MRRRPIAPGKKGAACQGGRSLLFINRMDSTPETILPVRGRPCPHLPHERHNRACILLVTVCSQERRPLFARRSSMDAVLSAWKADGQWIVGRYVFLPDHIHFFCAPGGIIQPNLNVWMRKWKARVSRVWPEVKEQPIWQRGHWDRQLRSREHYDERWEYVRQNPVRAGLCERAGDWPWQGEVERLVL